MYVCLIGIDMIFTKFSAGKVLGFGQIDAATLRSWCAWKTTRKSFDFPH